MVVHDITTNKKSSNKEMDCNVYMKPDGSRFTHNTTKNNTNLYNYSFNNNQSTMLTNKNTNIITNPNKWSSVFTFNEMK